MEEKNLNLTHILVIPYPAQGHMIPILDLTHHLAATGLFTVTVVVTPKNLPILSPLLSSHSLPISPLVLPFPADSGIPAGAENTKDLPPASFRPMMFALSKLQDPLHRWFSSLSSPPVAVISDIFCGWTHRFASELGIKSLVFSPSGAMALSVIYSLWRDMPKEEDCKNGDVLFSAVPNSPKYPWWQLSPVYRSYVEGEDISEFIKEGFRDDMASWGLVINSFDALERVYLRHLMSVLGHQRVWAVGPLVPPEEKAILTGDQMEAVGGALEKSGVRFIWCAREPKTSEHKESGHGRVPPGFEDRTASRGVVIKEWAPQVAILNHPAVGTFLTHCGWNSVLEGLMAGVELLAWPMGADQFSNATLLVDQLNIGVRVCEGASAIPNPNDLAGALADSVSPGHVERRKRILKLRNDALEAVKENGSSSKEMHGLVNTLNELRTKPQA
ncbi:hypothetical protein Cgig2_030804 [Carnegiea gigantea]|uniref:Glycosyltransferase n=1 Tax=Carnegiea gigantea TaxID=171969 RepID=A0A9Q1QN71_9CARY|nr:hypothetical protein Cgig2_030804 [Carnegiea gigantea]